MKNIPVSHLTPALLLRKIVSLRSHGRKISLFVEFCQTTNMSAFLEQVEAQRETYSPLQEIAQRLSPEQVFNLVFNQEGGQTFFSLTTLSLLCEFKIHKNIVLKCWEPCDPNLQFIIIKDLIARHHYEAVARILNSQTRFCAFLIGKSINEQERKTLVYMLFFNNGAFFRFLFSHISEITNIYHILMKDSSGLAQIFMQHSCICLEYCMSHLSKNQATNIPGLDKHTSTLLRSVNGAISKLPGGQAEWPFTALLAEVFFIKGAEYAAQNILTELPWNNLPLCDPLPYCGPYTIADERLSVMNTNMAQSTQKADSSAKNLQPQGLLQTQYSVPMVANNMMVFSNVGRQLIQPQQLRIASTIPTLLPPNFTQPLMIETTTNVGVPLLTSEASGLIQADLNHSATTPQQQTQTLNRQAPLPYSRHHQNK